jgi:hypothetical protein
MIRPCGQDVWLGVIMQLGVWLEDVRDRMALDQTVLDPVAFDLITYPTPIISIAGARP